MAATARRKAAPIQFETHTEWGAYEAGVVDFQLIDADDPRREISKATVAQLAASIRAHGLINPLIVTAHDIGGRNRYRLLAGYHRHAALKKLKTKPDQLISVRIVANDDVLNTARILAENYHRRQLTPIEEADAFTEQLGKGAAPAEVAAQHGVTERYVRQRVQLAGLVGVWRERLVAGDLQLRWAQAMSAMDPDTQARIYAETVKLYPKGEIPEHMVAHALTMNRIDAKVALFDLDAAGIAVDRDLFDDKGAGFVRDSVAFFAAQRDALAAAVAARVTEAGAAWSAIEDLTTGEQMPYGTYGRYVYDGTPKLDPGEELGVVGILGRDGGVRITLRVRDKADYVEPDDDGDDEPGQAVPAHAKAKAGPDLSQAQEAARDEVRALLAAGCLFTDHTFAMRMAIVFLARHGTHSYDRSLANIAPDHPSPAARDYRLGAKALARLSGLLPVDGDVEADPKWLKGLHREMPAGDLSRALMRIDDHDLPHLLCAALAMAIDPGRSNTNMVEIIRNRAIDAEIQEGEAYRPGEYELKKLRGPLLDDQAREAGLESHVRPKRKVTIGNLVAWGKAQHDAGQPATILPLFAGHGPRS